MNRLNIFLAVLTTGLLAFGGYRSIQRSNRPVAPIPGFSVVDSAMENDLRELASQCETAQQWHALANIYLSAGFFAEADVCYAQAIRMKPDWGDAIYHHAFCLSRFGKTELANQKFEQVIALNHPKTTEACFFLGQNYLRDGNPELAETTFRRASKLPMAKFELARLLFRNEQFDESESLLGEVLEKQPNASMAKLLMSSIAAAQNKQTRATSFSTDGSDRTERIPTPFVEEKNRLTEASLKYGLEKETAEMIAMMQDGNYQEAKSGLEKIQSVEWLPHVQDALTQIAISTRDYKTAEQLIEEEISRSGPTTLWLGKLGSVRMELGDTKGAVDAWTQGAQVRNDLTVSKCFAGLGQFNDTQGDVEQANKYQVLLMLELAQQGIDANQQTQSIEYLKRGLKIAPQSAELYYLLGKVYRTQAEFALAAEAYKRCLERKPNFGRAIRELKLVEE